MEGMNIIAQTPVNCTMMGVMFVVLGIILIVGPAAVFLIVNAKRTRDVGHLYVILGFILGISLIFTSPRFFNTETGQYTYECTFDEDVTVNSIAEYYDIISFNDGVWTVRDKEQ